MKHSVKNKDLLDFSDRVASVVTELNGLVSHIVNEEVIASDFEDDLTELFGRLATVEGAVYQLADLFWR